MKKLLGLTLALASIGFVGSSTEANAAESVSPTTITASNTVAPQWRQDRYNRRGVRISTQTRIVRVGRQRYREVYQVRYLPNGRVNTRLISRTRIR